MMSDQLEEIKGRFVQHAGMDIYVCKDGYLKGDIKWLIAEVERLRSQLKELKEFKDWAQAQLDADGEGFDKAKKEIKSLTEERDELQEIINLVEEDHSLFGTPTIKNQLREIKKLEAEKAQLKDDLQAERMDCADVKKRLAASEEEERENEPN